MPKFSSSLGIKYPTLRDNPLHTGYQWLNGKRADDGAEGLWRIHNDLYNLNSFIHKHPGGAQWIELTKGTDITEAFETHHLNDKAKEILPKFWERQAKSPRNSPFTFNSGDFYQVLKGNIKKQLGELPKWPMEKSKLFIDLLAIFYIFFAILAAYLNSFTIALLAGILLSMTAIAAHNFFHQKDNFRMFYFNLTLLDYKEWRISHALSHHLHTNTVNDLEISSLEPFIEYLPGQNIKWISFLQILISPVICLFIFLGSFIRNIIQVIYLKTKLDWANFLPFVILGPMLVLSGEVLPTCLIFLCIQLMGSLHFAAVGVNAAHHHPQIFHDGDKPRPKNQMDWGIYQLDTVMDRKDITGSHFLVLTNFGDHALHHLFPTLDHGLLEFLYPTFLKTCVQFGLEWRLSSQIEMVKGQFMQIAKTTPNPEAPTIKKML